MSKLLTALLAIGLISVNLAWADDMDSDRVIREEHVTPAVERASQTTADRGQDSSDAHDHAAMRSHPESLDLDSLGLYFGLGEDFIVDANLLIEGREAGYSEHGSHPVYSRLSSRPRDDSDANNEQTENHNHEHERASASDDANGGLADHTINRRGSDHDYFYD